ncbi:MAG: DUF7619 domain-containing protein [Fluviicola sp.]
MKILNYLTAMLFLASIVSFQSFGQGYQLTGNFSNMYVADCDSTINLNVSMEAADSSGGETFQIITQGTNPQTSSLSLFVLWGDGTSSTHTGASTGLGTGIVFTPPLTHTYPTFNDYTMIYQISNPANNSFIWDSLYYTYANCDSLPNYTYDFCLSGTVYCDQDSNGVFSAGDSPIPNALVNFSYNGSSWTASANQNGQYSTFYMGTSLGMTTTVQVNQNWLNQNGYAFQSSPFITGLFTCGMNQPTFNLPVNCNIDTTTPPNYTYDFCLAGMVYCDQDTNGVFSAGDSPIPNALINFSYNGTSWSVTANQNGQYSTVYMGTILGGTTTVQVNQTWLNQNGYAFQSYPFTTWADTCGMNQPTMNLPIYCDIDTIGYHCVNAKIFCDANGNGIHEPNETLLSNAPLNLWTGVNNYITLYSDSFGMVSYCGWFDDSIPYTYAALSNTWLNNQGYALQVGSLMVPLNGSIVSFPVNCAGSVTCANLYANVMPWIGYYQNTSNTILISYGNDGPSSPGAYQVSLTFPAGATPIASSFTNQNYTITGNTMTWNFTGTSAIFDFDDFVLFHVPSGITSGTNHAYTISITPTGSVPECHSSNNSSTLNLIVGQSYDPNDKTVHNQKYIDPMEADLLTYVIRFQNTGTAPAQDVYIIDTISSNLDFSTLEILETSHNLNVVDMGNNVIKFDYPQIWLPDSNANEAASHGYVIYKIKEKENNPIGSSIENTAYIYFDWNPAIITNTTININSEQTNSLNELKNEFSVYPNPFNDQIHIKGTTPITGYEFIDAAGKVILKNTTDSNEVLISTAELTAGLYYLNILSEDGNTIQKIVKH